MLSDLGIHSYCILLGEVAPPYVSAQQELRTIAAHRNINFELFLLLEKFSLFTQEPSGV